jgi:hypothetical protein
MVVRSAATATESVTSSVPHGNLLDRYGWARLERLAARVDGLCDALAHGSLCGTTRPIDIRQSQAHNPYANTILT